MTGIQGSGKSTQGNLLSKELSLSYLSTGHIFRMIAKEKTKWGRYVKETMGAGLLLPDAKTVKIVEEYLSKPRYASGYILDGFPRSLSQAKSFKEKVNKVFYLKVSDREALWRLAYRNDELRGDETVKAIRKRIEIFHKVTEPVLDYYRQKRVLVEIDGEQPIKKVFQEILSACQKGREKKV